MEFLFHLIVVLHFVGLALLLGAFLVQVKDPNKTRHPLDVGRRADAAA